MTRHEILSQLLNEIPDKFDKTEGSFFFDALMPTAIELESIYKKASNILDSAFAKTARGEYLDLKVAEQGISRNLATFAKGNVIIAGENGAIISVGDKVSSQSMTYSVTEQRTIIDGIATVPIVCDTSGQGGNVPIGAVNKFPVTLPRLTSVTNTEPITGGYDAQTDEELRAEYFAKVSTPSTSGNAYHYKLWAREVAGVGGVKVFPLRYGAGTVGVIIVDANGGVGDAGLLNTVKAHIEDQRPIGASVTVEYAEPLTVDISVTLKLKSGAIPEEMTPKIADLASLYLKEIAFVQDYVSYAHLGSRIFQLEEVVDYSNLTLNGAMDNIPIQENQVAVLGGVTVN